MTCKEQEILKLRRAKAKKNWLLIGAFDTASIDLEDTQSYLLETR